LRAELDRRRGQRGVPALRAILDRGTFVLTESELERRFVPIAARAGLGRPQTQRRVTGFKVDFFWPGPGLVAETNGLRYHRTAEHNYRIAAACVSPTGRFATTRITSSGG
jgi:hypothetical protein